MALLSVDCHNCGLDASLGLESRGFAIPTGPESSPAQTGAYKKMSRIGSDCRGLAHMRVAERRRSAAMMSRYAKSLPRDGTKKRILRASRAVWVFTQYRGILGCHVQRFPWNPATRTFRYGFASRIHPPVLPAFGRMNFRLVQAATTPLTTPTPMQSFCL